MRGSDKRCHPRDLNSIKIKPLELLSRLRARDVPYCHIPQPHTLLQIPTNEYQWRTFFEDRTSGGFLFTDTFLEASSGDTVAFGVRVALKREAYKKGWCTAVQLFGPIFFHTFSPYSVPIRVSHQVTPLSGILGLIIDSPCCHSVTLPMRWPPRFMDSDHDQAKVKSSTSRSALSLFQLNDSEGLQATAESCILKRKYSSTFRSENWHALSSLVSREEHNPVHYCWYRCCFFHHNNKGSVEKALDYAPVPL